MIRSCHLFLVVALLAACSPPAPRQQDAGSRRVAVRQAAGRPDAPVLKRLPNGHYRLKRPWTVRLNGRRWDLPKGYSTNGMTAPLRVKAALGDGPDRPETWAAVFHDWLFTQPGISRAEADQAFLELLLAYDVPAAKARLMYSTVKAYSLTKGRR